MDAVGSSPHSPHSQRRPPQSLVVILAIIFGGLCAGYALIGWTADFAASKIPDDVESELFAGLGTRHPDWHTAPKGEAEERAKRTFARLVKARGLRHLRFALYFMPEKDPNAFALPGGAVAVTAGMLRMVKTEIGMAMVLGHELGHQQHRHALRTMGRGILLAGVVSMTVGSSGSAVSTVADLAERSNSRNQEFEADKFGLQLVRRQYGTTVGALEFFERLEADPATRESRLVAMLSSHPYTPERLARLRQQQKRLESSRIKAPEPAQGAAAAAP